MLSSPTESANEESKEEVAIRTAVFRPSWCHRSLYRLLPDEVIRDLLHGRPLPPTGVTLTISFITHTVSLEVVKRFPDDDHLALSESSSVHVVPPLPPTLCSSTKPQPQPQRAVTRCIDAALSGKPLAPYCILLHAVHAHARIASASVAASAKELGATILRYAPPTLGSGHGRPGVRAALKDAWQASLAAAPAVLLIDSCHLLAPAAIHDNAGALTLTLRDAAYQEAECQGVAVVLISAPNAAAINALVRDECQAIIEYRHEADETELTRDLRTLAISAQPWCSIDDQVGGSRDAKEALERALLWRRTRADAFKALGIVPAGGVLLYGAPGTGKTLVVRAAARRAGYRMHAVEAARLARGEVGESERLLDAAFDKAVRDAPSVLFVDEIDAMFGVSNDGAAARLVEKLATRMDEQQSVVVVVAATNRPWRVSPVLLRAGRLEVAVHTRLPSADDRVLIARVYAKRMQSDTEVAHEIECCAERFDGLSGADIAGACRRAAMQAAARGEKLAVDDVTKAFGNTKRSVSQQVAKQLENWRPPRS